MAMEPYARFFFFLQIFLIDFSYILAKKSEILTWC